MGVGRRGQSPSGRIPLRVLAKGIGLSLNMRMCRLQDMLLINQLFYTFLMTVESTQCFIITQRGYTYNCLGYDE